jgi:phosphoglycolate phosphatase
VKHLIALDLDGTLEDSRDDMVGSVLRVRAGFGLSSRSDEEFRPHVNAGMDHLYKTCFADLLARGRAIADVRAAYEADYLAHIADTTRLYPGIAESVAALAELGKLACVTNKPERLTAALLAALAVAQHFSAIIGGDTCAETKPSPIVLAEASRRVGRTGRAVMIGDSRLDVLCGRSFGAATIWCAWGYAQNPGDQQPDLTARSPGELPGLVRRLLARASA